ncbi:MAG: MMPL family transporter [Actinomycetota bacterium]|nr:MMPL family transporter [Actinomycetota bacterium]
MFARLGRACYDHRRAVALLWLVLLVLGVVAGSSVFGRLGNGEGGGGGWESVEAYDRLGEVTPYGPRLTGVLDGRPVQDADVRRAVVAAREELAATGGVARVVDAYAVPLPDLWAADGRASLVAVDLARDLPDDRQEELLAEVERRLRAIGTAAPVEVTVGGTSLVRNEVNEQVERDTQQGELVAMPLSLIAMIVIFGGLAAAGVPFLGALASIAGGLLSVLGWSYVLDEMDPSVVSVTTVLGLGLSIDYALLVVSRYREERGAGLDPRAAVERTSATAGRTITYSALVVATSLSALFVFPTPIFRAIAAAGVSVVLVALLAGLTLTPALIGLLGRRIKAPTRPVPGTGFFSRFARGVQRRPLLVTLSVAAVLLAAGSPFLHARFQNGGADLLPREFESRRFVDLTEQRFPSRGTEPITVLAEAPLPAVEAYAAGVAELPGVRDVRAPEQRGPYAVFEVVPVGDAQGDQARGLVDALRAERPEFRTWVTGDAAVLVDFLDEVTSRVPYALACWRWPPSCCCSS